MTYNNNNKAFYELLSDFYQYMIEEGGIAHKTSVDYISRLKFLANNYMLDKSITIDYIEYILEQENIKRKNSWPRIIQKGTDQLLAWLLS